ncbi:nucleoside phosphorylase domain-containing protein [Aspergillus pseudoustus]|uniref:Nucleoside phosphorylase domain-containing protein n=1 Tax=Aspergillus pseudoustus TaxID=1810923 RepID=A0ABR4K651_9EURO
MRFPVPQNLTGHLSSTNPPDTDINLSQRTQTEPAGPMASPDRRPEPLEFRRAIVCALPREFDAVEALFDEHYDNLPTSKYHGDPNFYRTGRIGTDYIVLTCLAEMGKGSAASAASTLRISFPNIDFALVVGICGGVPLPTENSELILGDVVMSHQVVKFDFGRQYPDRFEQKGSVFDTLDRSHRDIRNFLSGIQTRREKERFQEIHSRYLQSLEEKDPIWRYPGVDRDRLFPSSSQHVDAGGTGSNDDCDRVGCQGDLVQRLRLTTQDKPRPVVHIGAIASGDTVMKSAEHREQLARKLGIVGFDMEGAGVCDSISCLVIKGACDYADSHKNKIWQDYAAASAAACTKALLESLTEHKPEYGAYIFLGSLQNDTKKTPTSIVSESTTTTHDTNQHINEALRCLERGIPNKMMRRALIPAATDMIESSRNALQNLPLTRYFESKPRDTMFGTLYFQTKTVEYQKTIEQETTSQTETRTSFVFHPAPWLLRLGLRYGLKAMAINHHRTWQYTIRPVHAVPDDSLIFSFARRGNVDAVRELLLRREASVFDVDTTGWTPLHTATFYGQFEMARFLISEGADKRAYTYVRQHQCLPTARILQGPSIYSYCSRTALSSLITDLMVGDCSACLTNIGRKTPSRASTAFRSYSRNTAQKEQASLSLHTWRRRFCEPI